MSKLKIVIIDDNFQETDPLKVSLEIQIPEADIILRKKASEGLSYILENLSSKMIVLLDYDLGQGEENGTDILLKIREKTSLIYIIMITAKLLDTIPNKDLMTYVNKGALAVIDKTVSLQEKIELIKNAIHKLDTRVDSVLEQWILNHTYDERETPYLKTSTETYTLNDVLKEIRTQTPLGQKLERNIMLLAVDLLTRGKKELGND